MGSGRSKVGTEGADDSVGIEKVEVEVEVEADLTVVLESSNGREILTDEHMCRCVDGCVRQITYLLRRSRLPGQQDRLVS